MPSRRKRMAVRVYWVTGLGLAVFLAWIFWGNVEPADEKLFPVPATPPPKAATAKSPVVPPAKSAPAASPRPPAQPGVRPVRDLLEAQIAMERLGISSGSIDGVTGSQTRQAVEVFQRAMNLPVTRTLDPATMQTLLIAEPVSTQYTITPEDAARPRPLGQSWLAKSQQDRLDYETLLELVAERTHAHPKLLQSLNPRISWPTLQAGAVVTVPRVEFPPAVRAARVRVHLASRTLQAFDERGMLLAHFPCSIASRMDKRPLGELHVATVAPNPDYTFDPALFLESPEAHTLKSKLKLAPGPNNPVGSAWIGLDRPGYGIHGTPSPEAVGRTESHGCFRLANWNAERLLKLVWVGMPVIVEE